MIRRSFLAVSLVTFPLAVPAAVEVRWLEDHSAVDVTGLDAASLKALETAPEKKDAFFALRVEGVDASQPSMLGAWSGTAAGLRFTPRYPLTAGLTYEASWKSGEGAPVTALLRLPKPNGARTTVVEHIYPAGDRLPENLLKFYIHFSAPMTGGDVYRHLHLKDDNGKEVELPFLEVDEELWDREMKRLTVFIDPGRIKRGVKPLEDVGPALVAGKRYSLTVDVTWRDAKGLWLKQPVIKKFTVLPPDRTPPDQGSWIFGVPRAGDRTPLKVEPPETLDHALALRLITVAGVAGQASLNKDETEWTFTPDKPWSAGTHRLVIQPELEDLAGNSIGKAFEVDISGTEKETPAAKPLEFPFEIK